MDVSRIILAQEFLCAGRRHVGIEEPLAATYPACGAVDVNTRHARLCHRAGAGIPAPALGPRDLPLPEAHVRPPISGKRYAL